MHTAMVLAPVIAAVSLTLFIPVPVRAVVGYALVSDTAAPAARSCSSPPTRKGGVSHAENKQNGQKYCQGLLERLFIFSYKLELFHGYFPQDKSITGLRSVRIPQHLFCRWIKLHLFGTWRDTKVK